MVNGESAERINRVLNATDGPFSNRGRRLRYDENRWYSALAVMPELTDEERRHVVAFLTRSKTKHEQDAAWMRGGAYTSLAGALGGVLALDGWWRAVLFAVLAGVSAYIQSKLIETHEPAIAYTEGLLAALAETPRRAD